jgi:hypothetical protein
MAKGGKRPGAGRPKGSLDKRTLDKKEAEKLFTERVLKNVDRLFNAQFNIAEGATYLYRIEETGEGKNKVRKHVLVADPYEIERFLNEHDGADGQIDNEYYYITTKTPDNKAIDSLMDRAFGKAVTKIAGTGDDGELKVTVTNYGDKSSLQIPAKNLPASSSQSD